MMDSIVIMEEPLEILETQSNDETSRILKQSIIDQVVMKAINSDFKSQQKDQYEFSLDEKRKIAEDILNSSHLKFLYLFGEYLIEDHLEYFKSENNSNFEINFHLHRLSRLINSKKVISKNRRYQAMLELLNKGEYFSDNEMRNREPLLWEQLVGQYLSDEEKFNYDNLYVAQNSLTEVLFEQIDRDKRDDLQRKQQLDEIHKPEEEEYDDSDSDSDENGSNKPTMPVEEYKPPSLWGEYSKPKNQTEKIGKRRWKKDHFTNLEQSNIKKLSENEKLLLLNEFKSHMINKFLSGEEGFDYSNVDDNPEYDNLHIKAIDEEEKYFDAESPVDVEEATVEENIAEVNDDVEEDELDCYMRMLKKNEITDGVADQFKHL